MSQTRDDTQDSDDLNDEARDVEESEAALDAEEDSDPVGFWEKKQRSLLTSAVDYNLSSLSNLIKANRSTSRRRISDENGGVSHGNLL
jgi:hypothetical protein